MPSRQLDIDSRLIDLVKSGASEQQVRVAVNEVFKDEAVAMRNMVLAVSRSKLTLITKLMTVADAMADTFSDEELVSIKEEFKDEPLPDRIKMFQTLVNSIMSLSASSSYVLDLEAALSEFERTLVPAETSTKEKLLFKSVMEEIGKLVNRQAQEVSFRELKDG